MKIREEAQAIITRKNGNAIEFLLLKRRYTKGEKLVQMRLVKGGIKPGETPEEAAKREIKEETGLNDVSIIEKLGGYEYEVDEILHRVSAFLVELNNNEVAQATTFDEGDAVIDDVIWVSKEEVIKLLTFPEEQEMIRLATNFSPQNF